MSSTATDLQSLSRVNSQTTRSRVGLGSVNLWRINCFIPSGYEVHTNHVRGVVLQSFLVEVKLMGEEYVVTSSISNSYEFGEAPALALKNYFAAVIDELKWLEEHEAELSPSLREDLRLLHSYIRIV